MGAIVSTNPEVTADENYPTAVTAAQAKIRHELLKEHFKRMSSPAKLGGEGCVADPEWFPAGVSPRGEACRHRNPRPQAVQVCEMSWMDSKTVSSRELHYAATNINKSLYGSKNRKVMITGKQRDVDGQTRRGSSARNTSLLKQNKYYSLQDSLPPQEPPTFPPRPSSPSRNPPSPPLIEQPALHLVADSDDKEMEEAEREGQSGLEPSEGIIQAKEIPLTPERVRECEDTNHEWDDTNHEWDEKTREIHSHSDGSHPGNILQDIPVIVNVDGGKRETASKVQHLKLPKRRQPQNMLRPKASLKTINLRPQPSHFSTPYIFQPSTSNPFTPHPFQPSAPLTPHQHPFKPSHCSLRVCPSTVKCLQRTPNSEKRGLPAGIQPSSPHLSVPQLHTFHASSPHLHTSTPQLPQLHTSTQHLHASSPHLHTSTPHLHIPSTQPSSPHLHTSTPHLHIPSTSPQLHTSTPHLNNPTTHLHTTTPHLHTATLRSSTSPTSLVDPSVVAPPIATPTYGVAPPITVSLSSTAPVDSVAPAPFSRHPVTNFQRTLSVSSLVLKKESLLQVSEKSPVVTETGVLQEEGRFNQLPKSSIEENIHPAIAASNAFKIATMDLIRRARRQKSEGLPLMVKGTDVKMLLSKDENEQEKVWSPTRSLVDVSVPPGMEASGKEGVDEIVNREGTALVMSVVSKGKSNEADVSGNIDEDGSEHEEWKNQGEDREGRDREQEEEEEGELEEEEEEEEEMDEMEDEESKGIDSLVEMLYSEIAEDLEEHKRVEKDSDQPSASGNVGLPSAVVQKMRTALVIETMQNKSAEVPLATYGEKSILLAPADPETLMKAGEFRGDAVRHLHNLTPAMRLDYYNFVNDYDQTFFYAAQQLEGGLKDYTPQIVLLISSTVPKHSALRSTVLPNVLVHTYDFHHVTPQKLVDKIHEMLDSYKPGAMAKYLGIVCKGGPGYFYLMKNTPVTPAKIRNNVEVLEFWQKIGARMSKLIPGQSVIHLMESNVAGNRQGEKLLLDLEYAMFSHHVKVKSPLEVSPSGRSMLGLYFNTAQHKTWKISRYSKLRLFKVNKEQ